ncbi:ATP-binding protein [Streptomyces sp. NBC_01351]|uniref:ATP-binding protein n=1 Tax=Streptomyces sp. NBC_01351 TaxID=2903833 RepID=UPI002E356ACB|nr:ATP-binding protein [Streptomyces sp. NBC_01351]
MQIGHGNRQNNYYDQRTYGSTAGTPSDTFGEFERQLRLRTPCELRVRRNGAIVERATVDRTPALREVTGAMARAAGSGGGLLVHGEPSVGKSVLCLQAVDRLREAGAEVVVVDLRDCSPPLPAPASAAGVPLAQLFARVPASAERLLVLDGAEVVQEGARDRFLALADAARHAGLGVVTVVRDDALAAVEEAFGMLPGIDLTKVRVEPLPDGAAGELVRRFPALGQLRGRRSRWLLRRVGLVDLLLGAEAVVPLRDGGLSEADVFDVCWRRWVRSQGRGVGDGQSPDARERALLEVARLELGLPHRWGGPDPVVLPSLRSDGLVRSFGPGSSFRSRESFVGDVVRDFAVARLLLTDGLSALKDAGAPRWTTRAAVVACQARLIEALEGNAVGLTLSELPAVFDELASAFGARWTDVPWEAVLSTGSARRLIRAATPLLLRDDGAHLAQLLRVAEQRFVSAGRAEVLPVEGLVGWLAEQTWHTLDVPRDVVHSADRVVREWLRGAQWDEGAEKDPTTREVRQAVRAVLLTRDVRRDDIVLEALATLGSDLDEDARARLRQVAQVNPATLRPVVESPYAVMSLRENDVDLLAELALAYYVDQPGKRTRGDLLLAGDGVRDHEIGYQIGVPRAAPYYGPFWSLLCGRPAAGLLVINALLHHATSVRCGKLSRIGRRGSTTAEVLRVDLDLLGLGPRAYAGDSHVYAWYRGSTVGPAPCTSALLAWERAADQLLAQGLSLRETALSLLHGAKSVAAVGVIVGFLVRHLSHVTDELDEFLAVPELWDFEDARTVHEMSGLAIRDEEGLPGREWRRKPFREVAAALAARAVFGNDETAADRLRQVGARLLTACPADADGRPARRARLRAAILDTRNYVRVPSGNGLALEYVEPADLAEELEGTRRELSRTGVVYELANRYRLTLTPPFALGSPSLDSDLLAADVARARGLLDDPPTASDRMVYDTVVAVAAAVVRMVGAGVSVPELTGDDLRWAYGTVVAAVDAPADIHTYEGTLYSLSADRSAAFASPSLFQPAWDPGEDPAHGAPGTAEDAAAAVTASMTSTSHEVRRCVVLALRRVWAAPCGPAGRPCPHQRAWQAVESGARDVAVTAGEGAGRRLFTPPDGDLAAELRTADAADLMLPRIAAALVAALDAVSSSSCVAEGAAALRDALLDAYARTATHWAQRRVAVRPEEHALVADALLAATETTPGVLQDMVTALGGRSEAAADLLRAACTAATYCKDRRTRLRNIWPALLESVPALSEHPRAEGGSTFGSDRLVAALIPAPAPVISDGDTAATIERAQDGWPTASSLAHLVPQWIARAVGVRGAVETLIGFLRASPVDQQLTLGLPWVRALVLPGTTTVGLGSLLINEWLSALRASPHFDAGARTHYEVIVDVLAAAGSSVARELQQEDE